ncbi:MAG: PDZ domain-containing protein [Pirellulaceae bacterium]
MRFFSQLFAVVLSAAILLLNCPVAAQVDTAELEEQAIRAAADAVAPSVVRIETVGGLERVGKTLAGTGPTTGLVVAEDGYVISSAINFIQQPASILVTLPSGKRATAKIVARDHARMLVLLKVASGEKLPVPVAAPRSEMAVGQSAIAMGRTFDKSGPSLSVGVLSALNRIWGRAIQTDAKISPTNYGGPLIDLRGRVIGVLVPLSPQGQESEMAGSEWYDSGIGFAVPLVDITSRLETLKAGKDLKPGLLGISLKRGDIYSLPADVAAARADGPAGKAGIKTGDEVVEIDGAPVKRQAQLKHLIGAHYAGDKVKVVVRRGSERIESTVELTDKMEAFQHPFLGVLPIRDDKQPGVLVRYVYAGSPAEKSGMKPGDRIVKMGASAIVLTDAGSLRDLFAISPPGQKIAFEVQRGSESLKLEISPAAVLPTDIPPELPAATSQEHKPPEQKPATGIVEIKLAEEKNNCVAFVPETYHPDVPHGVVVWLHGNGGVDRAALAARWKAVCEKHQLIVLAPQALDPNKWEPTEAPFVRKSLDDLLSHYSVDRSRIVVYGYQNSGSLAFSIGLANMDRIRAIIAVDAALPPRSAVPENDPLVRLAFFLASADKSPATAGIKAASERLRAMKYPVTSRGLGDSPRDLNDAELAELVRWIDALDRI